MYELTKKTRSLMKRYCKGSGVPNPFEGEELEEAKKKKHRPPKPKHPENLWLDVYEDLHKSKQTYDDGMKENGLSITPAVIKPVKLTPLETTLQQCDLSGSAFIFEHLEPFKKRLTNELTFWFNTITQFYNEFLIFFETCENDWNRFNYYNDLIHNFLYDFSWNVDMNRYVGTNLIEPYKLIDNFLSSFVLMMDRMTGVKNFLIKVESKEEKSYIITDSSQSTAIIKQGEFKKMDKSLFIKPEKTKLESMTEKASKFMGLTISINDLNKKEFFGINKLDETKYCYFAFGIAAREITTTTKQGKKLKKYVFNFDHLKNPVYIPQGMALMACDENNNPFGVVAVNKTEYTKALILDLASLTASEPDIVEEIDKSNKDNFKIIY